MTRSPRENTVGPSEIFGGRLPFIRARASYGYVPLFIYSKAMTFADGFYVPGLNSRIAQRTNEGFRKMFHLAAARQTWNPQEDAPNGDICPNGDSPLGTCPH